MSDLFFARHRAALAERLRELESAALFFAKRPSLRNGDAEYRYRPDSDFWYLTGFAEPYAALLILPGSGDEDALSILFLRPNDPDEERWTGRRLGIDAAVDEMGFDGAFAIEDIAEHLPKLLEGYTRLMVPMGSDEARDRQVLGWMREFDASARSGRCVPREILDPSAVLHELRLRKDDGELERMRRAAEITREAHLALLETVRPGMREFELEAVLGYHFRRMGSTGPAYTPIVAGGANACTLHYNENDDELRAGQLVLVDAGAEADYYACDVTRTFPVDGTFTGPQRDLYAVCLRAQEAAIECVRPGARFSDPHTAAHAIIASGLVELGLVDGPVDDAVERGDVRRFFPHKTSHWLGLDVHDCGAYASNGKSRELETGMVLTIEPGIYVACDDLEVDERWRGIGIRIEDDVAVTEQGCEVLTAGIPKQLDEVEARLAAAR